LSLSATALQDAFDLIEAKIFLEPWTKSGYLDTSKRVNQLRQFWDSIECRGKM